MGSCGSKDNKSDFEIYNFSERDYEQIKKIYTNISNYKPKTAARKTIGKGGLENEFQENPEFAVKLYKWMLSNSDQEVVTLDSYCRSLQQLVQNPISSDTKAAVKERSALVATTVAVSIEKYSLDQQAIARLTVTYSQALRFMKEVLNIFRNSKSNNQVNDLAAKVVVDAIFTASEAKNIDFNSFIFRLTHQLKYLENFLRLYYNGKFVDRELRRNLTVPFLDNHSYILSEDLVALFTLTCKQFQTTDQLTLLYSMSLYGGSFGELLLALKGYEGPTLVLLKHIEKDPGSPDDPKSSSVYVFGGFSNTPWQDELNYQGNSECFVFSLIPKFKKFHAVSSESSLNYTYLNSKKIPNSKYKVGLGFGGTNYDAFRLWIDEDMEKGSYTSSEDQNFEKGSLIDPSIKQLNIAEIEIWGLGGLRAVAKQEMYRINAGIEFKSLKKLARLTYTDVNNEEDDQKDDTDQSEKGLSDDLVRDQNLKDLEWKEDEDND